MPTHTRNQALCVGFLGLVVVAVWVTCLASPRVWDLTGIGRTPVPYLDLYGSLAAGDVAHAHGDPYAPNPLDPYHRPHLYSAWWLATADIGLTRADATWLGPLLWSLGLVATLGLLRPRGIREAGFCLLFLCSPPLLMAVNRGNNDWGVFLLVSGALYCLQSEKTGARLVAVGLIAIAGCLKYFPFAGLLVIAAFSSKRQRLLCLAVVGAVVFAGAPAMVDGLRASAHYLRAPTDLFGFGASTIVRDLGYTTRAPWAIGTGFAALVAAASFLRAPVGPSQAPFQLQAFVVGAALTCAAFSLGASYAYKLMFAVWMLPWLWHSDSRIDRYVALSLGATLWLEGLAALVLNATPTLWGSAGTRLIDGAVIVSQLLAWALTGGCVIVLTDFLRLQAKRAAGDRIAAEAKTA